MKNNIKNGFTLIEMVIVMAVIGILASVAVPRMLNLSAAAENTVASGNKEALRSLYETTLAQNSKTNPAAPWPTLYGIGGGTPPGSGFSNKAGAGSNFPFAGATISQIPAGNACEATTQQGLLAAWMASPYYDGDSRTVGLVSYGADGVQAPNWGFSSGSSCTIRIKVQCGNHAYPCGSFANPGVTKTADFVSVATPAIQGQLPVAVDNSGYCIADGWKIPTFKDGPSTQPTTLPADVVKSLGVSVADQINCPAGTFMK